MSYELEELSIQTINEKTKEGNILQIFCSENLSFPIEHNCYMLNKKQPETIHYGNIHNIISPKELIFFLKISNNYGIQFESIKDGMKSSLIIKEYLDRKHPMDIQTQIPFLSSIGKTLEESIDNLNRKLLETGLCLNDLKKISKYGRTFSEVESKNYFDFKLENQKLKLIKRP